MSKNIHHILIRHFKTKNEQIDYNNSYDEAEPYVKFILNYVKKYHINEISILSSSAERTLLTGLVLFIKLEQDQHLKNIIIEKPKIDEKLFRDPTHSNVENTQDYYKNYSDFSNNKLIIHITHSSVYRVIFEGILSTFEDNQEVIKKITRERRIHSNSLSYINNIKKNNKKYNCYFNGLMSKDKK